MRNWTGQRAKRNIDDPLYKTWRNMRNRCNGFSRNKVYRHLTIYQPWINFKTFSCDINRLIGPRPSSDHSIDRIDNDKGYFPDNVRWATWSEQQSNKRHKPNVLYRRLSIVHK